MIAKYLAVKIGLWFMVIFSMVSLFGWDLLNDMERLRFEAKLVERSNHQSHDLHNLEVDINRCVNPVKEFLITGDYRLEAYFTQLYKRLVADIKQYEQEYSAHKLDRVLETLNSIKSLRGNCKTLQPS